MEFGSRLANKKILQGPSNGRRGPPRRPLMSNSSPPWLPAWDESKVGLVVPADERIQNGNCAALSYYCWGRGIAFISTSSTLESAGNLFCPRKCLPCSVNP